VFTSDVPIFQRLMSSCTQVDNPRQADLFLVPYCFGTSSTLGWDHLKKSQRRQEVQRLERYASSILSPSSLEHYSNATAPRHLFLYSNDVQFLFGLYPQLGKAVFRSLVVHLGDDRYLIGPKPGRERQRLFELPNSLTVPYRVSHWMPAEGTLVARPDAGAKRFLVVANVNRYKNPFRSRLLKSLQSEAERLNVTDRVKLHHSQPRPLGTRGLLSCHCSSTAPAPSARAAPKPRALQAAPLCPPWPTIHRDFATGQAHEQEHAGC
jgi:hypothetical protein